MLHLENHFLNVIQKQNKLEIDLHNTASLISIKHNFKDNPDPFFNCRLPNEILFFFQTCETPVF